MKDEANLETRQPILDSVMMDDVNYFSWDAAKPNYTILLCRME